MEAAARTRRRVVLVDDDDGYLSALSALLAYEDDIDVVGVATNGRDAVALVERVRPDVVVMDVEMPVMDGVEAARRVAARFPRTIVLLVSGDENARLAEIRTAGAADFLRKLDVPTTLVSAIARVSGPPVTA